MRDRIEKFRRGGRGWGLDLCIRAYKQSPRQSLRCLDRISARTERSMDDSIRLDLSKQEKG
jgi:hypothetical protein